MSAKYTPGPWHFDGWDCESMAWAIVVDSRGDIVANVNTKSGPDIPPMVSTKMPGEANANLIVAAPELLESLESITLAMLNMRDDADTAALFGEIKAAQPTIVKAKGGAA